MLAPRNIGEILAKEILPFLPPGLVKLFSKIPSSQLSGLTEIRLRHSKPLTLYCGLGERFVDELGQLTTYPERGYRLSGEDVFNTLLIISQSSLYSMEEELRNGFITLRGGHRVGFVGEVVVDNGRIRIIKNIASFNFRISRELPGVANPVIPLIIKSNRVYNTLVISPPGCGKTTIIRDITRQLSDGIPNIGFKGVKVGVVDERSEIAGAYEGIPLNNIGIRTDVIDACPKAEGMLLMIRSMSPQVLIADEIGRLEDTNAIREAVSAGVNIIVTAHGASIEQLQQRPCMIELLREKIFERYIFLGYSRGIGTIEQVLDENFVSILPMDFREATSCG